MTLLAGDGFVLRPLTAADVPLMARWRSGPRVSSWSRIRPMRQPVPV